jgi:hypothetical protein
MKIVVDAMGGDLAPGVVVDGAVQAARDLGLEIVLVGQRGAVQAELDKHDRAGLPLTVLHASEVIAMDEHNPAAAVKAGKDSSMVVGMEACQAWRGRCLCHSGPLGGRTGSSPLPAGPHSRHQAAGAVDRLSQPDAPGLLLYLGHRGQCRLQARVPAPVRHDGCRLCREGPGGGQPPGGHRVQWRRRGQGQPARAGDRAAAQGQHPELCGQCRGQGHSLGLPT